MTAILHRKWCKSYTFRGDIYRDCWEVHKVCLRPVYVGHAKTEWVLVASAWVPRNCELIFTSSRAVFAMRLQLSLDKKADMSWMLELHDETSSPNLLVDERWKHIQVKMPCKAPFQKTMCNGERLTMTLGEKRYRWRGPLMAAFHCRAYDGFSYDSIVHIGIGSQLPPQWCNQTPTWHK